ncbi:MULTISPECIES: hypothetical protein [Lysinibacillus]|nr:MULTISPECIES: hypothetical protein [Lysinibacillus]
MTRFLVYQSYMKAPKIRGEFPSAAANVKATKAKVFIGDYL